MLLSSSIGKNIQLPLIHLVNSLAYLTVLIVCTQHIRKSRGCLRAVLVPETNILSLGKRRSWFCNCCNFSHFGSYCFCSITVFTHSEVPGSAECSHSPVLWSATFSPLHSALSQGKAWSEQSCFCDWPCWLTAASGPAAVQAGRKAAVGALTVLRPSCCSCVTRDLTPPAPVLSITSPPKAFTSSMGVWCQRITTAGLLVSLRPCYKSYIAS